MTLVRVISCGVLGLMLTACGSTYKAERPLNSKEHIKHALNQRDDIPNRVKVGKPYKIKGITYRPHYDDDYQEYGVASWYGPGFHGKKTANGETYNQYDLTAAHRTLPLPSLVRVTHKENGRSIIVRVNDRGPFSQGRIIDLSEAAARLLDVKRAGTAPVRVDYLEQDTRQLWASLELRNQPNASAPIRYAAVVPAPVAAMPAPMPLVQVAALTQPAAFAPVVQTQAQNGFVQAGSFGSMHNADRFAQSLSHVGGVAVKPIQLTDGRLFYRVQVTPRNGGSLYGLQQQLFDLGISDAKIRTQ